MAEAVKKAGVIHMVAFNYRRTPAVALAKKYIDDGRIGRILNFRGTYLQDWSADENGPLSWRFQKKIAGSGTVGDIGTHVVVGPMIRSLREVSNWSIKCFLLCFVINFFVRDSKELLSVPSMVVVGGFHQSNKLRVSCHITNTAGF